MGKHDRSDIGETGMLSEFSAESMDSVSCHCGEELYYLSDAGTTRNGNMLLRHFRDSCDISCHRDGFLYVIGISRGGGKAYYVGSSGAASENPAECLSRRLGSHIAGKSNIVREHKINGKQYLMKDNEARSAGSKDNYQVVSIEDIRDIMKYSHTQESEYMFCKRVLNLERRLFIEMAREHSNAEVFGGH